VHSDGRKTVVPDHGSRDVINTIRRLYWRKTMPTINEIKKGHQEFQRHEQRDAMYKTASFLVSHFWDNNASVADGMGVLLLTWNQAFYRYGSFDFDRLEQVIKSNKSNIQNYRSRDIGTLSKEDEVVIEKLFNDFLDALQIASSGKQGTKSPVAVAKALHLLAPNFFPLWDSKIARAYNCNYSTKPAAKYICFSYKIKDIVEALPSRLTSTDEKITLKLVDEYNYARYTKNWI
jgi:hypothetical protein